MEKEKGKMQVLFESANLSNLISRNGRKYLTIQMNDNVQKSYKLS
jgi:hypothetical protein